MPLAIDFGTSNTVAALWDADTQDARSLPLADLTVAAPTPMGGSSMSSRRSCTFMNAASDSLAQAVRPGLGGLPQIHSGLKGRDPGWRVLAGQSQQGGSGHWANPAITSDHARIAAHQAAGFS